MTLNLYLIWREVVFDNSLNDLGQIIGDPGSALVRETGNQDSNLSAKLTTKQTLFRERKLYSRHKRNEIKSLIILGENC